MEPLLLALLLLAGLTAGFLSGLFGIGGGVIMTPVLHYVVGHPWPQAVAVSLLAITVQSPLAVHQHARRGAVDWRLGILLSAAGLVGVLAGDLLLPRTPLPWLKVAFGLLLVFAAWRLVARVRAREEPAALRRVHGLYVGAAGAFAAFIGRLFGVGGGIVTVPALAFAGTPVRAAIGSSLVIVFTASAVATGANLARGIPWVEGLVLGAAALVAAPQGVKAAHGMEDRGLRRAFALLLVVVAAYVVATSGL